MQPASEMPSALRAREKAIDEDKATRTPTSRPSTSLQTANPVLVEVTRGSFVESCHRGAAIVVDSHGATQMSWGNTNEKIFPRSMIKPMQAVALVASGAGKRFGLGPNFLALAAASSFGEPRHVELLKKWARIIEVPPEKIRCGIHRPFNKDASNRLLKDRQPATVFHNNNCGKHLALLTISRYFASSLDDYLDFDHPVQKYVRDVTDSFMEWRSSASRVTTEICGIPTEPIPIRRLAYGFARMASPLGLPRRLANGARTILSAMRANPELVSGHDRMTAWLVRVTDGKVIVKGGSEGGQTAIVPDLGIASVLKIDDGADRASPVALADILRRAELLSPAQYEQTLEKYGREIRTYSGSTVTGKIRSCL